MTTSQPSIVSASRRTDIPAFYGPWFLRRIDEGFVGCVNHGRKSLVSLRRENVTALAFWSKDYRSFLPILKHIQALNYPTVLNCTVTGLPRCFESNVVPVDDAIDNIIELSCMFSPEHINWHYDPVVVSSNTPPAHHVQRFTEMCATLQGHVKRCYFSFPVLYGKVNRNLSRFEVDNNVTIIDLPHSERVALAQRLATIAAAHGIEIFTCSGDYLIGGTIKKAHCIDGDVISRLYYGGNWQGIARPTRAECGCTASVDIGAYDTCPHGCVYCYGATDTGRGLEAFKKHDPESAFLGFAKSESDQFFEEIRKRKRRETSAHDSSDVQRIDNAVGNIAQKDTIRQRPSGDTGQPDNNSCSAKASALQGGLENYT